MLGDGSLAKEADCEKMKSFYSISCAIFLNFGCYVATNVCWWGGGLRERNKGEINNDVKEREREIEI